MSSAHRSAAAGSGRTIGTCTRPCPTPSSRCASATATTRSCAPSTAVTQARCSASPAARSGSGAGRGGRPAGVRPGLAGGRLLRPGATAVVLAVLDHAAGLHRSLPAGAAPGRRDGRRRPAGHGRRRRRGPERRAGLAGVGGAPGAGRRWATASARSSASPTSRGSRCPRRPSASASPSAPSSPAPTGPTAGWARSCATCGRSGCRSASDGRPCVLVAEIAAGSGNFPTGSEGRGRSAGRLVAEPVEGPAGRGQQLGHARPAAGRRRC